MSRGAGPGQAHWTMPRLDPATNRASTRPIVRKPVGVPRKGRSRVSDEQVVEMRRLHEYERHTGPQLAETYGLSLSYVWSILSYRARVKGADGSFSLA